MSYDYQPVKSSRHKILVAEDLSFNIFTMKFMLHSLFKLSDEVVTYTQNGKQAYEKYVESCKEEKPYSLMILDFKMPKMTGIEVMLACDALRDSKYRRLKRPYFVMETGEDDNAVEDECLTQGFDLFCQRPMKI